MIESWKDVLGYEGSYQCSSQGRVRSIDRYVASKCGSTRMSKGIILAIKLTGKKYNLGLFNTQEEAHAAYLKARSL